MSTTTTPVERLINTLIEGTQGGIAKAYEFLEDILLSVIIDNILTITLFVLIILFLGFIDAIITGNWRIFGSMLYRFIYSISVIIIILILGVKFIFSSAYLITSILIFSPLSFRIVGYILKKLGFKR